jgi:pSer/pThr/pTyr-binding forkhead associated (FHA) protein
VRDEGSSNGTFVNGVRIQEQPLFPGDIIRVGSTELRFEF